MAEPLKFKTTRSQDPLPFEVDEERFHIWPIRGWSFVEFARSVVDSDDNRAAEAEQAAMLHRLFEEHMDPDEFERWEKFAKSPRGPGLDDLVEISKGLVQASSNRPTEPPSPSGPGRHSTGPGSTDASSSPESTPED